MVKKYKAFITDVDGTLIPNKKNGQISPKVIDAIEKAKNRIHIGLATSRHPKDIFFLTEEVQLSGPSIVYGGAQIVDVQTKKVLWQQGINLEEAQSIIGIALSMHIEFLSNDLGERIHVTKDYVPRVPLSFWGHGLNPQLVEAFYQAIRHLPKSGLQVIPSWQEGKIDFLITHTNASKQYALYELAKLLAISPQDIIGVGDGKNDLPLLMACGLKIAMGNAVPELLAVADYIAPSVEDDGIADILEKFVL